MKLNEDGQRREVKWKEVSALTDQGENSGDYARREGSIFPRWNKDHADHNTGRVDGFEPPGLHVIDPSPNLIL